MAERTRNAFVKAETAQVPAGTVTAKTTLETVAEANPARVELYVCNDGAEVAYLALGPTPVAHKGIRLNKEGGAIVIIGYLGKVTCITAAGESILTTAEV